jgi:hypothetical protein
LIEKKNDKDAELAERAKWLGTPLRRPLFLSNSAVDVLIPRHPRFPRVRFQSLTLARGDLRKSEAACPARHTR